MLKPEVINKIVSFLDNSELAIELLNESLDKVIPAELIRTHCYKRQASSTCHRPEEFKRCVTITDTQAGTTKTYCSSSWFCDQPSGMNECS